MVELVDTRDLKSLGHYGRAGSSPALRTITRADLLVGFCYVLAEYKADEFANSVDGKLDPNKQQYGDDGYDR